MPPSTSASSTVGQARHPQVSVMSLGQCDLPQGQCGHCHHPYARGTHSGSTGGDRVPLQPTPWPPSTPGKPKWTPSCHPSFPNPRIPKSQNSPFWKGPRKISESNNAQHGSSKGFESGKAAPAKGLCIIHGEGSRFGDIKDEIQGQEGAVHTPALTEH